MLLDSTISYSSHVVAGVFNELWCVSLSHHNFVTSDRGQKVDHTRVPYRQSKLTDRLLFIGRRDLPGRIS